MRVLVTAGSTQVPIDRVRSIGNMFKGKTGNDIADDFASRGAEVTLLTSTYFYDDVYCPPSPRMRIIVFRTFDELAQHMEREIRSGAYDVVIHSAAVSDYVVSNVFEQGFDGELMPIDNTKKIPSTHECLYLELVPAIKLIDQIREPWGFRGTLVKFKLQVGISDAELIAIAEKSMKDSQADYIVANCLEWYRERAYILTKSGSKIPIKRQELSGYLYQMTSEDVLRRRTV